MRGVRGSHLVAATSVLALTVVILMNIFSFHKPIEDIAVRRNVKLPRVDVERLEITDRKVSPFFENSLFEKRPEREIEFHQSRRQEKEQMIVVKEVTSGKRQPIVWFPENEDGEGPWFLRHAIRVFHRLGYIVKYDKNVDDWDVLWVWDYPFYEYFLFDLKPHQKVNHFPGAQFVMKDFLMKSGNKYLPPSFVMPKDKDKFINYSRNHPNKLWVRKGKSHKGVQVVKQSDILKTHPAGFFNGGFTFFDGRNCGRDIVIKRFDFGVYTVVTSINPLRIYILDETNFRFCPKPFYPIDLKDKETYVIKEPYKPIWEMPSLKHLYKDLKFRTTDTMNAYFRTHGYNPDALWRSVKDAITSVIIDGEPHMRDSAERFESSRNFFELYRLDFLLDENMKLYLMEVNMSPNLAAFVFPPLKHLFEHVVYNTLMLTGLAKPTTNFFSESIEDEADMRVADRDIVLFPKWCTNAKCSKYCNEKKCKLCLHCLTVDQKQTLKSAFLEHVHRGSYSRLFPPLMTQEKALAWTPENASQDFRDLDDQNQLMYTWFIGKCQQHQKWCY